MREPAWVVPEIHGAGAPAEPLHMFPLGQLQVARSFPGEEESVGEAFGFNRIQSSELTLCQQLLSSFLNLHPPNMCF